MDNAQALAILQHIQTDNGLDRLHVANLLGVSWRTVQHWQIGKGEVSRPVQRLLLLLAENPALVERLRGEVGQ